MCTWIINVPGFCVKLLQCFSNGERSSTIPSYTALVQSWAKLSVVEVRENAGVTTISLAKAVPVFVSYIQILGIQKKL